MGLLGHGLDRWGGFTDRANDSIGSGSDDIWKQRQGSLRHRNLITKHEYIVPNAMYSTFVWELPLPVFFSLMVAA